MNDTINSVINILADAERPASGIVKVQQFLSTIFTYSYHNNNNHNESSAQMSDKVASARFIIQEQRVAGEMKSKASTTTTTTINTSTTNSNNTSISTTLLSLPPKRTLGFWRLDNSAELIELVHCIHSLVLTSGTLSPLDHFAA